MIQARPEHSTPGLVLTAVSLLVMTFLATAKSKTGRRLAKRTLQADAEETRLCSYLSAAVLVGLGLNAALGWWWADPWLAWSWQPWRSASSPGG